MRTWENQMVQALKATLKLEIAEKSDALSSRPALTMDEYAGRVGHVHGLRFALSALAQIEKRMTGIDTKDETSGARRAEPYET